MVDGLEVLGVASDQRGTNLPAGEGDQGIVDDPEAFFEVVPECTLEHEQDTPSLPEGLGTGIEQPSCSRKGVVKALNEPLVCAPRRPRSQLHQDNGIHVAEKRAVKQEILMPTDIYPVDVQICVKDDLLHYRKTRFRRPLPLI